MGGFAGAATATQASINQSSGAATFANGTGGTLVDCLADIATRFTASTNSAGEFPLFEVGGAGSYYMFISEGVARVGLNDVVVQLANATSTPRINLTVGNLTITGLYFGGEKAQTC